ncbi:flagellar biosynthetic protein FliR [Halioglobus japonicus]|uniref:Flagellar biosynthetic protein FliR n=1 Tax=Halioglobus japonicus TaxID=930805 RepID=A0AAP8MDZ0_9GAMM|nr:MULTISPECIES: flagellar biosynthetic protein FliR [Halioglobus]AQA18089.1 flagellar biosynthetic protein FliR [Halioglobus japonicus]KZX54870.1 flagellar biosynthetic protein FliR [Halioglobus sp. HI00S01]PLW86080.1 flagellar biosynthetic protein FliR [Halioglobus japonicus]GHD14587.1 flagellar biosynthetic protein FliR [Halioglobus japonicus]
MLEVSFTELETWLSQFFWPFVRISGLVASAPLLGHQSIPMQAKIGLCVVLTIIVSPTLPPLPDVPMLSWSSAAIIAEQVIIGVAMGTTMRVVFASVQAAGDFIGLQMGLAFAAFFSPDTNTNTMIVARILYIVSLLLFVALDGHLLLIAAVAQSFQLLPIAALSINSEGFYSLAMFGGQIFKTGLLLALPVLCMLLIINLSMGILNRSAPQFTVFTVGFPISLGLGILLIALLMTRLQPVLEEVFDRGLEFIDFLLTRGLVVI